MNAVGWPLQVLQSRRPGGCVKRFRVLATPGLGSLP